MTQHPAHDASGSRPPRSRPRARPCARQDGTLSRTVGDETVVYDLEHHGAHCLNPAAAVVWRLADGSRSVGDLAGLLADELSLPCDEDLVYLAILELEEAGLMAQQDIGPNVETPVPTTSAPDPTRREVLGRLARYSALALAAPAVSSVVVPTASAAATCLDAGEMCVSGVECCSGICFGGMCAG